MEGVLKRAIGRNIKAARKAAGFSIEEVAALTGSSTSTVSRWERGTNGINLDSVEILATALGVGYEALLSVEHGYASHADHELTRTFPGQPPFVTSIRAPQYLGESRIARTQFGQANVIVPPAIMLDHQSAFLVETNAPEMDLCFPVGSFVLVDPEVPISAGQIALVCIGKDDAVLRSLRVTQSGAWLTTVSTNRDLASSTFVSRDDITSTFTIEGVAIWDVSVSVKTY